ASRRAAHAAHPADQRHRQAHRRPARGAGRGRARGVRRDRGSDRAAARGGNPPAGRGDPGRRFALARHPRPAGHAAPARAAAGGDVLGQRRRTADPRRGRRGRRGLRGRRPGTLAPAPDHPAGAGALRAGSAAAPAARRRAATVAGPQDDRAGQGTFDGEARHERTRGLRGAAAAGDAAEPEAGRAGAADRVHGGPARMSRDPARPRELRVGHMPLVDCAPLLAAARLGLDRRYGLRLELLRQGSWAAVRDKLLSGELDAAHALAGMVYGIEAGIGGPRGQMALLMVLNQNGQAIVLAPGAAQALGAGASLREALQVSTAHAPRLAQTFPTGTHAMWLYYWLAAQGIDPLHEVQALTLSPAEMPAALARGEIDGYCAGEPWAARAESLGAGVRVIRSDQIWPGHPEKVLACRRSFAALEPDTATA